MKNNKISICIPTWEQHGMGTKYLNELLISIESQTYSNYNVIISDHSKDSCILDLTKTFDKKIDIIYTKFDEKYGNGPANTNNAIKYADGDIIKIMFQDDLFYDIQALLIINNTFNKSGCKWLVNSCIGTTDGKVFKNVLVPSWNDRLLLGVNTIGSPSVISFVNNNNSLFDENLVMLMDCDYYQQLCNRYGYPKMIDDILVSGRTHDKQISSLYNTNDINSEKNYLKYKYNKYNL